MKSLKIITLILLTYGNCAIASEQLNFNWGSSRAIVTENITKDKAVVTIRYEISLEKHKQGYIVKQTNLNIISPKIPPHREAEKPKLFAAMSVPDLLVDRKGTPLDILDFEDYVNRVSSFYSNPKASELFQSPQMREMLYMKAQQNWCLWVCSWVNLNAKEGKPSTETSTIEITGMSLPQTITTEIHKNWEGSKNTKLTSTTTIGGEAAIRELTNYVQTFTRKNNLTIKNDGNPDSAINNFSKRAKVVAIIDPKTLKPASVISEELTEISSPTETKKIKAKHEYLFEWK